MPNITLLSSQASRASRVAPALLGAIMAVADKGTSGGKWVWGVENHGHTSGVLDIEGVGAAGEFSLDGSLLNYEAKIDMSEELAQKTAQYCVAISLMFNTLASSFTDLSGMNWVP